MIASGSQEFTSKPQDCRRIGLRGQYARHDRMFRHVAGLHVEPHDDFIAVAHDVVFADGMVQVGRLDFAFRTEAQQVVHGHDFGADEAAGKVAVDRTGGVEGRRAALKRPCADLLFVGRKERDLLGGFENGAEHPVV